MSAPFEYPTTGVLATVMAVDVGTDRERNQWVPWPHVPAVSRAEYDQLAAAARLLADVATGRLDHLHDGLCPDVIEGFDVRDDECPACLALIALDAALKPESAA